MFARTRSRSSGWLNARSVSLLCTLLSILAAAASSAQGSATAVPAEASDVATLPAPGPHRVFVMGWFDGKGANVYDAESDPLRPIGLVPIRDNGAMTVNSDASRIYTIETFYSHGNRGTRQDVLAIYDGTTLNLLREITLPGRLISVPRPYLFEVSQEGRFAYVYDMAPSSAVHVVALDTGSMLTSVPEPGCALAFPFGSNRFASLCGDGTLAVFEVQDDGKTSVKYSARFFDAGNDPVSESGVVDRSSGEGWLITYSGKLYHVRLTGQTPQVDLPWSITTAAGMPAAGTGTQELAWRPGGNGRMLAQNRATGRLYILMHAGNFWTHKQPGTEVWVIDPRRKALVNRIKLDKPARSIAVSQDSKPLLYVSADEEGFAVIDADTGAEVRNAKLRANMAWVTGQ